MRQYIITFALVAILIAAVIAYPYPSLPAELEEEATLDDTFSKLEPQVENIRVKRLTCDLLSAFNVKDSACAARCIAQGKKGGHCNDRAECNCRESIFG